jgi:hypothetical protein
MDNDFPKYLKFKNRIYSVMGYISNTSEYEDNKAYIAEDGYIYVYADGGKPLHKDVPYMTMDSNNSLVYTDTTNPSTKEIFKESADLFSLSLDIIESTTAGDEELYNEEALADMNAATSIFIPTINDNDDPLKKIIKQIIISKRIDINRLKHRMPQKYGLTNMKSALVGKTKMSITNFIIWCELLGVNFEISIGDNGTDVEDPLQHIISFNSIGNTVSEIRD